MNPCIAQSTLLKIVVCRGKPKGLFIGEGVHRWLGWHDVGADLVEFVKASGRDWGAT
jgi:hypothetical protein